MCDRKNSRTEEAVSLETFRLKLRNFQRTVGSSGKDLRGGREWLKRVAKGKIVDRRLEVLKRGGRIAKTRGSSDEESRRA